MRKKLISSVLAMLVIGGGSLPAYGAAGSSTGQEIPFQMPPAGAQLAYILTANQATFSKGTLKIALDAATTWTTRRSEGTHSAGKVSTVDFLKGWGDGPNSFRKDPPNAALVWDGNRSVIELTQLEGFEAKDQSVHASFKINVLSGANASIPHTLKDVVLWVDWGCLNC